MAGPNFGKNHIVERHNVINAFVSHYRCGGCGKADALSPFPNLEMQHNEKKNVLILVENLRL
jgi:hypothetical protein